MDAGLNPARIGRRRRCAVSCRAARRFDDPGDWPPGSCPSTPRPSRGNQLGHGGRSPDQNLVAAAALKPIPSRVAAHFGGARMNNPAASLSTPPVPSRRQTAVAAAAIARRARWRRITTPFTCRSCSTMRRRSWTIPASGTCGRSGAPSGRARPTSRSAAGLWPISRWPSTIALSGTRGLELPRAQPADPHPGGLTLFGVVRRTLQRPILQARFGRDAVGTGAGDRPAVDAASAADRGGDLHRPAGRIADGAVLPADALLFHPRGRVAAAARLAGSARSPPACWAWPPRR